MAIRNIRTDEDEILRKSPASSPFADRRPDIGF